MSEHPNPWTPGDWVFVYGRPIADDHPDGLIYSGQIAKVNASVGHKTQVAVEGRSRCFTTFHFMQLRVWKRSEGARR